MGKPVSESEFYGQKMINEIIEDEVIKLLLPHLREYVGAAKSINFASMYYFNI